MTAVLFTYFMFMFGSIALGLLVYKFVDMFLILFRGIITKITR